MQVEKLGYVILFFVDQPGVGLSILGATAGLNSLSVEKVALSIKKCLVEEVNILQSKSKEQLLEERYKRFRQFFN